MSLPLFFFHLALNILPGRQPFVLFGAGLAKWGSMTHGLIIWTLGVLMFDGGIRTIGLGLVLGQWIYCNSPTERPWLIFAGEVGGLMTAYFNSHELDNLIEVSALIYCGWMTELPTDKQGGGRVGVISYGLYLTWTTITSVYLPMGNIYLLLTLLGFFQPTWMTNIFLCTFWYVPLQIPALFSLVGINLQMMINLRKVELHVAMLACSVFAIIVFVLFSKLMRFTFVMLTADFVLYVIAKNR